tara:strand:- start:236 stop:538 length:303 start_codon:yes stop_codon:yes gene_type:complete
MAEHEAQTSGPMKIANEEINKACQQFINGLLKPGQEGQVRNFLAILFSTSRQPYLRKTYFTYGFIPLPPTPCSVWCQQPPLKKKGTNLVGMFAVSLHGLP